MISNADIQRRNLESCRLTITLDHNRELEEERRGAHSLSVDPMRIAWSGGHTQTFKRRALDVTGGESCTH